MEEQSADGDIPPGGLLLAPGSFEESPAKAAVVHSARGFDPGADDRCERVGLEACSSHQASINIGLRKKCTSILRIHAPRIG